MQFGLLHQAVAAANLSNLGWNPSDIKRGAVEWSRRQKAQSLNAVVHEVAKLDVVDDIGEDCEGRMFLSFHYSVYPVIFRSLGQRSAKRTIFSLIGYQTPEHCEALKAIANTSGIDIHFVQSGFRMISEIKSGLRKGHVGLALLDVPWSRTSATPDKCHAAFGGSFASLSTLERLIDLIDNQREIITVSRDGCDRVKVTRLGRVPYSEAFCHLGELIERDPLDYERLHQFHRFFSFDNPRPCLVTFRIKDQRYAVLGPSMRTMKLDGEPILDRVEAAVDGLCHDRKISNLLRKKIGDDFECVICL